MIGQRVHNRLIFVLSTVLPYLAGLPLTVVLVKLTHLCQCRFVIVRAATVEQSICLVELVPSGFMVVLGHKCALQP